jgi:hypothetical protein
MLRAATTANLIMWVITINSGNGSVLSATKRVDYLLAAWYVIL